MKINEPVVLLNAVTAAVTGDWVTQDYRYSSDQNSVIIGELTTGDTVTIEGRAIAKDENGVNVTVATSLKAFTTASFSDAINGPVPEIRAVKTGTNGPAKVILV